MKAIVSADKNWGIGCNGKLLIVNRKDQSNFKSLTMGKTIIMGHATFKDLPKSQPLKGRINIVLSRDACLSIEGAIVLNSLNEVLDYCKDTDEDDIFIIGGEAVYNLFIPYCSTAYVTKTNKEYNADRFFPNLDEMDCWKCIDADNNKFGKDSNLIYCTYKNYNIK